MGRRLMTSLLATASLVVLATVVIAAKPYAQGPEAPLFEALPTSVKEPESPGGGFKPGRAEQPGSDQQPTRLDELWVVAVGAVGLLLVIQMVRIDRGWRRHPDGGDETGNGPGFRDVLTDE